MYMVGKQIGESYTTRLGVADGASLSKSRDWGPQTHAKSKYVTRE